MTLAWTFKILISTLLLPPGNGLVLLGIAGIFRRRRWAFGLAVAATLLSIGQCLPVVADLLIATLENQSAAIVPKAPKPEAGAIVILGSGLATDATEYGGDTANERTLTRTRYGATLARRYALPVLVTGGQLPDDESSEAKIMTRILDEEYGIKARWLEDKAMDTAGNAVLSAAILKAADIKRVVLVTHAFHMPRARLRFEQAGLGVIPAPTAFFNHPDDDWRLGDFLPQPKALQISYYALHEWLGMAWIALTH